jgi:acyl-CoA thioester hydrolase
MFSAETRIKVRYVETDKMGIVHHSNYFAWFEIGRGDLITAAGITYGYMEDRGLMMPVVEAECKYINGARYGDDLLVNTDISDLTGAKVIFSYTVSRIENNLIIARARTKHAFVNSEFQVINIQKKYPDIWEKIS